LPNAEELYTGNDQTLSTTWMNEDTVLIVDRADRLNEIQLTALLYYTWCDGGKLLLVEGPGNWMDIYSLIANCKLCEIDPFAYLREVLDRVSAHPASRMAELTPSSLKS